MASPIRQLDIVERWDCHGCSLCCRGTTIVLSDADRAELTRQAWDGRPEFRGMRVVEGGAWWSGPARLAQRPNGDCVFLSESGRCRIHQEFGAERKPSVCLQFPFQAVSDDQRTVLTLRRCCPSAAADRGRTVAEQLREAVAVLGRRPESPAVPRPISRRNPATWKGFHRVAKLLDECVDVEREVSALGLIHGLRICRLLEKCRLANVADADWPELLRLLSDAAKSEAEIIWQVREQPSSAASRLFRRLSGHFVRCMPGGSYSRRWQDRWLALRATGQLAAGRGNTPGMHPEFPERSFQELAGPTTDRVREASTPLDRFLQTHLRSRQYVLLGTGGTLVSAYRRLALMSPMAWWLWRWQSGSDQAAAMVPIVSGLERGFVASTVHYAAQWLADTEQLERLIAWNAPRSN